MHIYNRSLPLSVVILSFAIGASAQNTESDFGNTFFSAVDASNLPVSSTVLSTVNSTLDNLDQLNDLKNGLESLRRNAAELEQLRNAFNNEYVSLYSIGNGRAPIGQIDDAYRGLQTTISNVDDAVGRLSDFQTSARGFTTSVARGIGTTTRYVGTIGDVLAIASAANTFADEEATLVEEINAVSSLAGVAVTTYAPATGAVLAPVQLTLLASDKYVDATRNVATDILGQMEDDKAEYLNAARQIILKATADNPELNPQEILALASPDLNRLGQDYFEIYEYQSSLHRAVYGDGISKLASGLGNAASGGAVERRYLENLDFFSGILSDQNSDLFQTLLTISTATSERVGSLNEIQSRIAQTLRQIEVTSGAVSSNLQQSFEAVQSIGQELENLSAPASFEAESDVDLLSPSGVIESASDAGLIITEDDEGDPVLGNNAGTNIEIPTAPVEPALTPEEIAEIREREAERRRQEIADLEAARDILSITQQDAAARFNERDNRLTILQFQELPKVIEASDLVSGRIQELRTEKGSTGLSASDQQLLLDLVAYEDRLQTEQERIARDITAAQNAISQYEATLAQVETQLDTNAASLEGPDYSIASDYTVPNFTPEGLTDWTNYEYELPAFDPTELLTSDLSNVVGYAVSVPVAGGTNRVTIDLVAEDNAILDLGIPGAITELEDGSSDLLDGFKHLYSGSGVDEYDDDSQWIYGEAATPEQFALRTGTATFNGGLSGYYAHGSVSDHTLYQDGVSGSLALEVDFGTNRLTGAGEIEIDTADRNETLAFSLNESTISETDSGFTRSLAFSANATLENERGVSGNLGGTFYGEDASEAAGSFAFDFDTGFSAGLWAAGEDFEGFTEDNYDGSFAIAYASVNNGTSTFSGDTPERQNGRIRISREQDGTPILSDVTDTFSSDGYENVTWGSLRLDFLPTNAEIFNYSGNWVDVDGITSPTDLQDRSGSAQFGGEILGGYVASGGIEENALGIINLTANFGTQVVSGQFQFGHSCSGSGLNGCASASEIQSFNEVINDYNGSGFGNHGNRGLSGVIGVFGGDSAHEIGGYAWLTDVGSYVGVFRAREDLSFSEFVTPTTSGTNDPSNPPGTDYSNYRGLAAYNGYNFVSQDYVIGFVSVETVKPGYATPVLFENTFEGGDLTNSVDSIGRDYSYMNWGSWENADNTITEVDGQGLRGSDANWIVYDPTTNLRTTGQATYNGDAVGLTSASAELSGNIQLTADFANDTVTGNMTLDTSNGQSWADASFDTTIRRDTDSSGFQGALTGSDVNSGVIFGGFAGPDAEEVGGGWQIDNANGTDGVGIFRAQN